MQPVNTKRTHYVGGLDEAVTESLVRAAFIPFGDIITVNVPMDQYGQKSRGFAFVEFEETEDALSALDNMHHSELFGKVITCTIAKPASTASTSKPVWEDETYMQQMELDKSTDDLDSIGTSVIESKVTINTPKANKSDEKPMKLPPGMVRCLSCGGFGKDLVKEHGHCDYCFSKLEK